MGAAVASRQRLAAAGLALPPPFPPAANYVSAARTGPYVFVAGVGPTEGTRLVWSGRVGDTLTVADGREAARLTALNALAILDNVVGLDRIGCCVRMLGLVRCTPEFTDLEAVLGGADEVIAAAFGPAARPAWTMVGAPSLPVGIAVEIESVFAMA